jgi:hypothetical protein
MEGLNDGNRMDLGKIGPEGVDRIHLTQDMGQWRGENVMNIWFGGEFFRLAERL